MPTIFYWQFSAFWAAVAVLIWIESWLIRRIWPVGAEDEPGDFGEEEADEPTAC